MEQKQYKNAIVPILDKSPAKITQYTLDFCILIDNNYESIKMYVFSILQYVFLAKCAVCVLYPCCLDHTFQNRRFQSRIIYKTKEGPALSNYW